MKCENHWAENGEVIVTMTISNAGRQEAKEIVQLYVSNKQCSVPRPIKELKGYKKIQLKPGETKSVSFALSEDAFSFWSEHSHAWVVEPGEFEVMLGASSSDIRSRAHIELNQR